MDWHRQRIILGTKGLAALAVTQMPENKKKSESEQGWIPLRVETNDAANRLNRPRNSWRSERHPGLVKLQVTQLLFFWIMIRKMPFEYLISLVRVAISSKTKTVLISATLITPKINRKDNHRVWAGDQFRFTLMDSALVEIHWNN